jgi:hypothetical protein
VEVEVEREWTNPRVKGEWSGQSNRIDRRLDLILIED